jgi:amino acid adenylation domain-containing protein/thioester reductase-like protein
MEKKMYNLTIPQKNIWNTELFYQGTAINNICGSVLFEPQVNFELLKKAIYTFIRSHDSFRLRFVIKEDICQYVEDFSPFPIELLELQDEADFHQVESSIASHCFDPLKTSLFYFTLFRFPRGNGGFIVNIHHLIADSWTLGLIAKEITEIYSGLVQGVSCEIPSYSYLDYIQSEQKYIHSSKYEADKMYWDNVLSSVPEPVTIPSVFSEIKQDFTCLAHRVTYVVEEELISQVKSFCDEHRISLYHFLMAIYSIYIGRVNHSDDFIVGTPILNRTNYRDKQTTGMYITTLPVRVSLEESLSFSAFVNQLATQFVSMYRHQKYPYQSMLQEARKDNPSLPNLYHVLLSYQITKTKDESNVNYSTNWVFNGHTSDDMDIHFFDLNDTGKLNIAYDYRTSNYTEQDIQDLHERIIYLIEQILQKPSVMINDLSVTPPQELEEILRDFNCTDALYPSDKTMVDLFCHQVSLTPDHIAIKYKNTSMTYAELDKKSNQVAHFLRTLGIKPNDVIALRLNKSLEMITGILGIIKSGACYLPIDLSYPQTRIDFMLKDSNTKVFLTNFAHCEEIEVSIPSYSLDFDNEEIYQMPDSPLSMVNSPDDLLYIIYTSGSTGTPKGVMITHRNVVRLIKNDHFQFDFDSSDVWTMFHSVAFDFSVWEMYGCLLYGGTLILIPETVAKDPNLFLDLLRKEKVTVLNQTPTYFYNLLDCELLRDDSSLCIRYIIYGGEALKPNLIKPWKDKYTFVKLINMYGITETTVHVTFRELDEHDLSLPYSNIGKPIPTLKVYVMDENLHILPFGVEGEMCVSGLGVCSGYLNRPELNESRFVPNPYRPKELLYRSADNAVLSRDGNLYYRGRIDNQVKIRGFRIELGEIETKLLRHPLVEKCVVLPKKEDEKDSFLVAYVVADASVTSLLLKQYISQLVPEYMIPSFFVFMEDIPLTNNGKVDRKQLLAQKIEPAPTSTYFAPRNDFEKTFQEILEQTLRIERIGIDDNILELGADSLTLMKITIILLEKNYLVNIQDIYELKTIRNIGDNFYYHKHPDVNVNTLFDHNLYYDFEHSTSSREVPMKNVLLTGATGYLGIHLLYHLVKYTDSTVYCLIRRKNKEDPEKRLYRKLSFYFGKTMLEYLGTRIKVINADITLPHFNLSDVDYDQLGHTIDVVIHSAALVSHYGNKDLFELVNVTGTKTMIDFCQSYGIYLNYISTTSISADYLTTGDNPIIFDEHSLYVGQNCNANVYIRSKFDAEYEVWKALSSGLVASVYRLGNITARLSDGKFQENDKQNAFLNRMIAFAKLKMIPESFAYLTIDLSPVDVCSEFIATLMKYESSYPKVFHIFNEHRISVLDLLEDLKSSGANISVVPDDVFHNYVATTDMEEAILGIINDLTSDYAKYHHNIDLKQDFTLSYLNHYDLAWPVLSSQYVNTFFKKYINGDDCTNETKL